VFAYNRPSGKADIKERQIAAFNERGLDLELLDSPKLTCVVGELGEKNLGLDESNITELKSSLTHIIHNAWKLDFNLSLSSFESQIMSTRSLIDFASELTHSWPVKFIFTSSVSSASRWASIDGGPVPESILSDASLPLNGYGASKFVCEHVLAKASEAGVVSGLSLRLGQISGSTTTGAWNPTDWVPIIVKSSIALGCLPLVDGTVSWLPTDIVADSCIDILFSPSATSQVVNIVHPRPVSWNSVFQWIRSTLGLEIPFVPIDQWNYKLDEAASKATKEDFDRIPGIKLQRFLHGIAGASLDGKEVGGIPPFSTADSRRLSLTLDCVEPLHKDQVNLWIRHWKKIGYLV